MIFTSTESSIITIGVTKHLIIQNLLTEHAEKLPHEERKAYAEKVVMAFWDAIGGDEEEVRDLT